MFTLNQLSPWFYVSVLLFSVWVYFFGEGVPSKALTALFILYIASIAILGFGRARRNIEWPRSLAGKLIFLIAAIVLVNFLIPGAGRLELVTQLLFLGAVVCIMTYRHIKRP